jgi:hypothetical protein
MGEKQIAVGTTDPDGNIFFSNLTPGNYNLKTCYPGYETEEIKNIEILPERTKHVSVFMEYKTIKLSEVVIMAENPLIDANYTTCCAFDRTICHYYSHCCCACYSETSCGVTESEDVKKSLKYYPNPTNGKITLEANDEIEELALIDESGRLKEQYTIYKSDKIEKDISNYTNGLYILQYQSKGKLYREKILLIH